MCEKKETFKVAFVIDSYTRGGVALAMQVLLEFLTKEDYEITVFVKNYDTETMLPVPDGVKCLPWEEKRTFSLGNRLLELLNWRNFGKKSIYQTKSLEIFPGEFDCAVAYQMVQNDVTVATLEKIRAKRKVLWLHGKKNFQKKDLPFYDDLYAKADKIVCVSLQTEERFRGLMPKSAEKTVTIHNVYDIETILNRAQEPAEGMEKKQNTATIVSVGRISKEKGFDRVPTVVQRLTEAGYDIHWYVVGDGNKKEEVEADIRERYLEERIHLLGHRKNPYPYVRQCDIYVQPSYTEGFCTSTMEAKILCKPVVTTDVPGMEEQFVSGENGLIVESSVNGIYEGIKQLLDHPEQRERIVQNLKAEPISNNEVLRQTVSVINGTRG